MTTLLRLPDVKARTGLSRSSIYVLISEGKFPKPVVLFKRAKGWVDYEVEAWIQKQIKESRK